MLNQRRFSLTKLELTYILGLLVLVILVYWPMWRIEPYADDFGVMALATSGWERPYAGQHMFRPLELFAVRLSLFLNDDLVSVKAFSLGGFLVTIVILFVIARRLAPHGGALPFVASALFACHPINVSAVIQIDTVSQQFATVAVVTAFAWYLGGPESRGWLYHLVGAFLIAAALFSKEVTIGAVLTLPLAVILGDLFGRSRSWSDIRGKFILMLGYVGALLLIYLALRLSVGAAFFSAEQARYAFTLSPTNVMMYAVMVIGASAFIGSTLDLFLVDNPFGAAVSVILSVLFNGLAVFGLFTLLRTRSSWREERFSLSVITAAALLMFASVFPAMLTAWPSELHTYLPLPFYVLVASFLALRGWASLARGFDWSPRLAALSGIAGTAALCIWMLVAINQKLAHAEATGLRSRAFLHQITQWYRESKADPVPVTACFTDSITSQTQYSIFAMKTYSLIHPITLWLNYSYRPWLHMPANPADAHDCQVSIEVAGDRLAYEYIEP